MNTSRIIGGGLAAGLVMNVFDFLINGVILKGRMTAEMNAVAPGLGDKAMGMSAVVSYVVMDFVLGMMIVWLYAAIRPRFGAGPRTAIYAGLFYWIIGGIIYAGWLVMGLTTAGTYGMLSAMSLVSVLVAASVGGMLYKEEGASM